MKPDKTDINKAMTDPSMRNAPSSRAILNMLRMLTDRFQDLPDETTDMDWTAFRALAKAGAVEGITKSTCTYADADGPTTEYYRIRGDFPGAMPTRELLKTEPFETSLVKARLTTTGIQWAEYLKSDTDELTEKNGTIVLTLILNAKTEEGYSQRVPAPTSAHIPVPACTDQQKRETVNDFTEHTDTTACKIDKITDMLQTLCDGALLQVGHSNLNPGQIKKRFDKLPPSRRKAWMQYYNAEKSLQTCTDQEAYNWSKNRLEPGEDIKTFSTWSKYVRDARKALGLQKNTSNSSKFIGKSIVSPDDI